MKDISVNAYGFSAICRLCLKSDITLIDIFRFSSILKDKIADVIMKYAPVQITRRDNLPNFVCQLCYTKLESIHQFQGQVIHSDNTLRRYLQQLHGSDKKATLECSIQKRFDDPVINPDITIKPDYLEFQKVFDNMKLEEKLPVNFNPINFNNEISSGFKIKNEPIDDNNSLFSTDYAYDSIETLSKCDDGEIRLEDLKIDIGDTKVGVAMDINWNEPVSSNNEIKEETASKSDIKRELINDNNSSYTDDTINVSSNGEDSKKTKTDSNFANSRSAEVTQSISIKYEKHKKSIEKKCDVCNTRFARLRDFQTHKRIHSGAKSHQCDVCNKCFTHANSLKVHKRTHTGEKPYQCDVCKKRFNQLSVLTTHKFTHTNMKPHRCDVCKKGFITSSDLRRHNRIHTGEKPYQCDVCQKSFSAGSNLRKHKLVHTGVKPYYKMSFHNARDLRNHKRLYVTHPV